ncbi:hypothetical protein HZB89_00650 [archaeon]|nr:hypothetical protein [archaeon]
MPQKLLKSVERIALFLLAFLVVVFFTLSAYDWADEWKLYFLRTENIEFYVYVAVFVFILSYVLRKLLVWQAREIRK